MKKIVNVFVCTLAAGLLMSGCMTEELVKKRVSDPRIELINSSDFKVELISSGSLIDDNGLLTVDARVLLSKTPALKWIFCGDRALTVYYRIDWLDKNGKIGASKVREMSVRPGNIADVHCVAAAERYYSYKLTVSLEKLEAVPVAVPAKKAVVKKAAVKKTPAKKAVVKKAAVKKAPAKKAVVKKAAVKKAPAKKAVVKKAAVKKAPAKKAVVKKAAVKKAPAKKAVVKKAAMKKAPAKKAVVKKAAVKKAPAKKAPAGKLTEPFN